MVTVARGPVPRDPRNKTQNVRSSRGLDVCCHDRCMARDRPSPYGNMEMSVILTGDGVRFAFAASACHECCAAFLTALDEPV